MRRVVGDEDRRGLTEQAPCLPIGETDPRRIENTVPQSPEEIDDPHRNTQQYVSDLLHKSPSGRVQRVPRFSVFIVTLIFWLANGQSPRFVLKNHTRMGACARRRARASDARMPQSWRNENPNVCAPSRPRVRRGPAAQPVGSRTVILRFYIDLTRICP